MLLLVTMHMCSEHGCSVMSNILPFALLLFEVCPITLVPAERAAISYLVRLPSACLSAACWHCSHMIDLALLMLSNRHNCI